MSEEKPSHGRVLATVRAALDLSQKQAAQIWGVESWKASEWERDKQPVPYEKLVELLAQLELPPEAIADTEEYVQRIWARRSAFRHPAAGQPSFRERIEEAAVATGRDAEDFTRRLLTRIVVEGDTLEAERRAVEQWERLQTFEPPMQRRLIDEEEELRNWALAVLIAEEGVIAAPDSARRALELAELAFYIAERVPGGEARQRRVMGYIGVFVANAWRVQGHLKPADLALTRADRDWEAGDGWGLEALDQTRRLDLAASLRREQRRFKEAMALLDEALAHGPKKPVKARLLINKAKVFEELGEPEAALIVLRQVEPLVGSSTPSYLLLTYRFNVVVNLVGANRHSEARALLPAVRALAVGLGDRLVQLRLRWLEAKILNAQGDRAEAAAALREVAKAFTDLGIVYDAALAVFDLALLFAEEGAAREIRAVAPSLVALFDAEGVPREAAASFRLLLDAIKNEQATAATILETQEAFKRAWQPPAPRCP